MDISEVIYLIKVYYCPFIAIVKYRLLYSLANIKVIIGEKIVIRQKLI